MTVTLRPITAENYRQVVRLKPAPDQIAFIEPNAYSIAESTLITAYQARAIYADQTLVGFLMFFAEGSGTRDSGHYWLDRFMIGAAHQRKGYGRAAVEALLADLRARPDCNAVYLSHVEGNTAAAALYQSFGFTYTGEKDDNGELIMRLPVPRPPDEGIVLKRVGREDFYACAALQLTEQQQHFVAPNTFSILQAQLETTKQLQPMAIYRDGEIIGFTLYNLEPEADGYLWIDRLMIDLRHQRKGYGRVALEEVVKRLRLAVQVQAQIGAPVKGIAISFEPENTIAEKLYLSMGFQDTGRLVEGEKLLVMEV